LVLNLKDFENKNNETKVFEDISKVMSKKNVSSYKNSLFE
jgi:hypothetical protein